MSTSFYVFETRYKKPRKCTVCNIGMAEGYLDENTNNTYCSAVCVEKDFTKEEIAQRMLDSLFWTTWYDETWEVAQ